MPDNTWAKIVEENPGHQWPLRIDVTVRVTSFEYITLWSRHYKNSRCAKDVGELQVDWKDSTLGLLTCLYGENTFPTGVHLRVDTLTSENGKAISVLFWELTSGKQDVVLAEDWIENNFPRSKRVDASDFWRVLEGR